MFGTTLLLAFREIRRHLLRSFLTTLGIIIGVAAVITMVTLGNGVSKSVEDQISSLGTNVLMVFPTRGDRSGTPRQFKSSDIEAIRTQIAGVKTVAGQVSQSVTAIHNGQNWATTVNGANDTFLVARNMELSSGRIFSDTEQEAGKSVCIIGSKVQSNIFQADTSPLGQRMRLDTVSCTVIGVLKERGQGGGGQDQDNMVVMPLKTVQRRFTGSPDIQTIVVAYDGQYDSTSIQNQLVKLLRDRRHLSDAAENDFNIIDTAQITAAVTGSLSVITAFLAAVAAISLIVGGVGIMNIMLVSVTERTREIGIRLAIGALAREVRMQFLTEAVVLCCLGGMVGMVLALGLSLAITSAAKVPFAFDPMINIVAFGFSALIGVVFGYFPAQRAAALDPIEALRHE
ncbi:ABC transporter permease [Stakelama sediminis]|uniref:Putative ABC transport system permease protein n=1 Tax=Stakelama sediminis TaxID=463200 RepID=A0A840YWY8_9SPHN|nr:ABC transporter permease [Stakelama sediminis]MBB5718067.1 putative ABC transport system permease protein [Stakelama sediminis]